MELVLKYKDALTAIQLASQDPFFIGEDPQGALDYIHNLAKEVLEPPKPKVIVGKPISPPPANSLDPEFVETEDIVVLEPIEYEEEMSLDEWFRD